jgi:hypothetical protein
VNDYIAAFIRQEEQICLAQNSRNGAACSCPPVWRHFCAIAISTAQDCRPLAHDGDLPGANETIGIYGSVNKYLAV